MSDDNVIQLPTTAYEEFVDALAGRPKNPNVALQDLMAAPSPFTPDEPSPEFAQLDIDALFNMREWVRAALETKGAKIVGAGIGCGGTMGIADIQIELDGCQCNIEIRPLRR